MFRDWGRIEIALVGLYFVLPIAVLYANGILVF